LWAFASGVSPHLEHHPFFDDNEAACQKLIAIVENAAHRATQSEVEALSAEYGPEARQALT
jgi:hypothetical protein